MSEPIADAPALPVYAKRLSLPHGRLKRWWVHRILRSTIKRLPVIDPDIPAMRARQSGYDARYARLDPEVRRTPVDCGGVAAEWLDAPESLPDRVLLYFHGGAFIFRFPAIHAAMVSGWSRPLAARALMVDYRLAPEHAHPAAPDDCYTAYHWLLAQGYAPRDIVFGGDSAGANLALATLHRVKAAGDPMPACAILLSPVVDFTLSGRSFTVNEHRDPMFSLAAVMAMRELYAPPERFLDPSVSPLFGDFTGFPPLLFQVGSLEILLDDSTRAAARAYASGVAVDLEIWDGMAHVFQALPVLPQAAAASGHIVRFVERHAHWN